MEKLIEILKEFEDNRTKRESKKWDDNAIAECFLPCAKKILCGGYFLVNKEYIIDLGAIELYYHEEEGCIKDYIMYHTNFHPSKSKMFDLNKGFPYFTFGSFNLHQSGVDVTFENKDKKYRASFLIRSYRVLKTVNGFYPINDDTEYDTHSTHIYDDMFYSGLLLSTDKRTTIEWIECDKGGCVVQYPRKNVAFYQENGKKTETSKDCYKEAQKEAEENKVYPKCFKYGNKYYMQDLRPWRFQLQSIKEGKNQ